MKMRNDMKIIYKKLSEIIPYEKNPRNNDEAVKYVANSIKEFGLKVPIIIDKNNVIVAGHTRYKASLELALDEVPCIIADDLTEEQIKAFRLADNKTAEIATWDFDLLNKELAELTDFDMSDFGFDLLEEDTGKQEIAEDNYDTDEEYPDEPKTKLGDMYRLGNHILLCGDSTDMDTVKRLVGENLVDLFLTDPPYNVDIANAQGLKLKNDHMKDDAFRNFLINAFTCANEVMKAGCPFYIWHSESEGYNFRRACIDIGWKIRQALIWNKNSMVMGRQDYHWKHEPCLYGWKDGASHYFIDDRTFHTVYEDKIDIDSLKKEELKTLLKTMLDDKVPTTVINEDRPSRSREHPTMKPIKLMARLIQNSSRKNEKVLDLFGGSGSTLIACEQLDRVCYMMEIDPAYCDVIIDRWEKFTGNTAEKIE